MHIHFFSPCFFSDTRQDRGGELPMLTMKSRVKIIQFVIERMTGHGRQLDSFVQRNVPSAILTLTFFLFFYGKNHNITNTVASAYNRQK